jgi:hypothetical protein
MYEKVKENFGHADVLVNNAGTFANAGPISQIAPDTWWSDFVHIPSHLIHLKQNAQSNGQLGGQRPRHLPRNPWFPLPSRTLYSWHNHQSCQRCCVLRRAISLTIRTLQARRSPNPSFCRS